MAEIIGGRSIGVSVPSTTPVKTGTPLQVTNVAPAPSYVAEWHDKNGVAVVSLVYVVGGVVYIPPNGVDFANGCKPMMDRMAKQVLAKIAPTSVEVPKQDNVEVLPGT